STSGCSSRSCARKSSPTRAIRAISSANRGSAIGSRPNPDARSAVLSAFLWGSQPHLRQPFLCSRAGMQPIVHVIATTFDGTRAAVAAAIPLAKGSGARLVVLVPRVVSYATELESPIDGTVFFAKRYEAIVHELGGAADVQICLCRTVDDVIATVARARSRVVVGGPAGRWLTSPE